MSTPVSKEITTALNKAKIMLMTTPDSVFFTTVLFSLSFKWDDTHPTAWTDGTTIGFNPQFFMGMSPEERVGVLIHEAMHVAYIHMDRLQTRCPDKFNQAADHVINLQLLNRGFKLPAIRLADPRFNDMGTEEVYKILMDEAAQGKPSPGNGMPDLRPSMMDTPELQNAVKEILVRASIQSKMAGDKPGSIPGDIELYLDNLLNPKLPWYTILRKFLTVFSKSDYSWKRPNRRFFPEHHLPSLHSESLMDLHMWVDISGSVTDADFKRLVSEVAGVFRMMKPKRIFLGQFDTSIKSIDMIDSLHALSQVKFTGRGGTNLEPVFDWLGKNKTQLNCIFTDGGFRFYRQQCKSNILWLINDNPGWRTPPFGKVIHYTVGE